MVGLENFSNSVGALRDHRPIAWNPLDVTVAISEQSQRKQKTRGPEAAALSRFAFTTIICLFTAARIMICTYEGLLVAIPIGAFSALPAAETK